MMASLNSAGKQPVVSHLLTSKAMKGESSLQCLSTNNMVFSDEDKILIKKVCI